MKKPTTITPELVNEYREFIELRLRKRVLETIELVMEEEVDQVLGCRAWECSEERHGYRNGTEIRRVSTSMGTRELRVPGRVEGWHGVLPQLSVGGQPLTRLRARV